MEKYVKKPVEVNVVRLDGSYKSILECTEFIDGKKVNFDDSKNHIQERFSDYVFNAQLYGGITIHTLEGDMKASFGDYIIEGINGEHYACKPDIFEKTYEKVKK